MFGYNHVRRPEGVHVARRREHNAAKGALIRWACFWCRSTGVPLRVCDLACGKGQDVNKWAAEAGVLSVYGSDAAEQAVLEARRRAGAARGWRFEAVAGSGHLPARAFGIVSMQFALHYFCGSVETAAGLLGDVARALVPGGLFIGTTVNEEALPSGKEWGAGYTFVLPGRIDPATEYRVPRESLRVLAASKGLRLCFWRTLHDWLVGAGLPSTDVSNHCYVAFAFVRAVQPHELGRHVHDPQDNQGTDDAVGEIPTPPPAV